MRMFKKVSRLLKYDSKEFFVPRQRDEINRKEGNDGRARRKKTKTKTGGE